MKTEVKRNGRTIIPHDIIVFDILTRLPVKSLSRFRCVSKLWNSTISDHRFVKSHQNRAFFTHSSTTSTSTTVLITVPEEPNLKLLLYSIGQPENEEEDEEEDPVAAAQVTISGGSVVDFNSQSIYGLICMMIGSHFKICNPSTREFITLPLLDTTIPLPPTTSYHYCSKNSFGYDPINNQHKVLSTEIFWRGRALLEIELIKVVHSVFVIGVGVGSSSSCWRIIDDGGHLHCPDQFGNDVCINGIVYNKAHTDLKDSDGSQVLVAFDVRLETFRFIAKPVIDALCFDKSTLIRFDGHLAIVDYTELDVATSIDFWVLEDSVKSIWIKKTIVLSAWADIREDFGFRVYIIGTIDTGEVVLAPEVNLHEPYYLFYFSLKNGSVRRVEVRGLPDLWRMCGRYDNIIATDHVENILSLSNLNS